MDRSTQPVSGKGTVAILRRINALCDRILFGATALSSMAFFVVVLVAIGVRAVPRWQFHASIELSRLFFVWSCFLAAGLAYRHEAHVGFTLLFDKMPVVVQRGLTSVVYSLVLGFVAVVLFQSVLTCFLLWSTVLPILGISQAWLYVPVPVLCLFMLFYTLEFIADAWRPAAGGSA